MKIYSTQNSESQVPEAASDEGLLAGGDSTESSGDTGITCKESIQVTLAL
jgi:hypothetical protein